MLESEIAQIERTLEPGGGPAQASPTTLYILNQHNKEHREISHLLTYYVRAHNGYHLNRTQWAMFVASVAIAATLLLLSVVQVLK